MSLPLHKNKRKAPHIWFLGVFDDFRTSYWFIPAAYGVCGVVLAFLVPYLDSLMFSLAGEGWGPPAWLSFPEPEDARNILSAISTASLMVASTIFSIVMVILSLASSHYGSRLISNFMRHGATQRVMGVFFGTFLYSTILQRRFGLLRADQGVSTLSIDVAILLGIISFAMLIFFVHHTALFIQAPRVLQSVSKDLDLVIDRWYPARADREVLEPTQSDRELPYDSILVAQSTGYILTFDFERLARIATRRGVACKVLHPAGSFVMEGYPLVRVTSGEEQSNRKSAESEMLGCFVIRASRTTTQDLGFALDQFVEVALRALSPGINDPFTAMACLDRLTAGVARIGKRALPKNAVYDDDGNLRVIWKPMTGARIIYLSFDRIRCHSTDSAMVTYHLLQCFERLGLCDLNREFVGEIRSQIEMVQAFVEQGWVLDTERARAKALVLAATRALGIPGDGSVERSVPVGSEPYDFTDNSDEA